MSRNFPGILLGQSLLESEVPPHIHQFSEVEGDVGDLDGVGDIRSYNWDGGSDLSSADTTATAGYFWDASEGAVQTLGNVWLGGNITLVSGGAIRSATTGNARVELTNVASNVLDVYNSSDTKIGTMGEGSGRLELGSIAVDFRVSAGSGGELWLGANGTAGLVQLSGTAMTMAVDTDLNTNDLNNIGVATFESDNNTYIASDTADQLNLYAGGAELLRLTESTADTITVGPASRVDFAIPNGFLTLGTGDEITVSSGVLTPNGSYIFVNGEGGASDDVNTITAVGEGTLLVVRGPTGGETVTMKDGTGNLDLAGDFAMNNFRDSLTLLERPNGNWMELSRSNNA